MKKNSVCPYLFIVFFLSADLFGAAYASGRVSLRAELDKKTITIGDDLKYTLSINFPEGSVFKEPDFQTLLSNFEIRNQKVGKSKKRIEYKYTLTSYTTGAVKIGPFEMEFTLPGNEKEKAAHPELTVIVSFLEPGKNDTDEIRDIKAPILPPINPLIYIAAILLLAAAAYYLFLRKCVKQTVQRGIITGPVVSPEETANSRLASLAAKKLAEQGLMKEYYIELSNIIRSYLAEKYKVRVIERTTDELFDDLKRIISKKRNLEIREFLESSDFVKFAKYTPGLNESRGDFERAKGIVNTQE